MLAFAALILLALAAFAAGAGALAWTLLTAAWGWGVLWCLASLLRLAAEDARRLRDWWRAP